MKKQYLVTGRIDVTISKLVEVEVTDEHEAEKYHDVPYFVSMDDAACLAEKSFETYEAQVQNMLEYSDQMMDEAECSRMVDSFKVELNHWTYASELKGVIE